MNARLALLAAAGLFSAGLTGEPFPNKEERIPRKCALPECAVMHIHNGGCCCAEHAREQIKRSKQVRMSAK